MPSKPNPPDEPHLPTSFDVQHAAAALRAVIGEAFFAMAAGHGIDLEGMAALVPLSEGLRNQRKRRGISYADAAKALGTSQKTLKAIEAGEPGGIDGAVLARYAEWLGLGNYLRRWAHAQPALAQRIGLPKEWRTDGDSVGSGTTLLIPDMAPSSPPPQTLPAGHTFPISPAGDDDSFAGIELVKKLMQGDPAVTDMIAKSLLTDDDDASEIFADAEPAEPATYEFEISLLEVKPRIWRRFRVQNTITLAQLHDVAQAVMGWTDSHLHGWEFNGERFSRPYPGADMEDDEVEDERRVRLADFDLREKDELFYEYDFGDGWEHRVVLKKILPAQPGTLPECLKGARACPPEDCGGPWRYAVLLKALANPSHPEHEDMVEWIGEHDAERFDLAAVNDCLANIARYWRSARRRRRRR
jgi:transcriptional regulator with XRE-family HTH domain